MVVSAHVEDEIDVEVEHSVLHLEFLVFLAHLLVHDFLLDFRADNHFLLVYFLVAVSDETHEVAKPENRD